MVDRWNKIFCLLTVTYTDQNQDEAQMQGCLFECVKVSCEGSTAGHKGIENGLESHMECSQGSDLKGRPSAGCAVQKRAEGPEKDGELSTDSLLSIEFSALF